MNDHDAKPKDDGAESLSTAGLGVVLHDTIEAAQGRSYISDGIGHLPDGEVVRISECSLGWHLECCRILRTFIAEHKDKTPNAKLTGVPPTDATKEQ